MTQAGAVWMGDNNKNNAPPPSTTPFFLGPLLFLSPCAKQQQHLKLTIWQHVSLYQFFSPCAAAEDHYSARTLQQHYAQAQQERAGSRGKEARKLQDVSVRFFPLPLVRRRRGSAWHKTFWIACVPWTSPAPPTSTKPFHTGRLRTLRNRLE